MPKIRVREPEDPMFCQDHVARATHILVLGDTMAALCGSCVTILASEIDSALMAARRPTPARNNWSNLTMVAVPREV